MKIPTTDKLICPYCRVAFVSEWKSALLGPDSRTQWHARATNCTACNRLIVMLRQMTIPPSGSTGMAVVNPLPEVISERMVFPRSAARTPILTHVPAPIADDYNAAARVLPESPEASAALSRRCLQSLLTEKAQTKKRDLFDQIQEVLDAGLLPTALAEDLDTVRAIGAFGAHPIKSKSPRQIVAVEPGEAEWNLDVLDDLFEFFYVQQERRAAKRAALDAKLKGAGKPTLSEMRKKS